MASCVASRSAHRCACRKALVRAPMPTPRRPGLSGRGWRKDAPPLRQYGHYVSPRTPCVSPPPRRMKARFCGVSGWGRALRRVLAVRPIDQPRWALARIFESKGKPLFARLAVTFATSHRLGVPSRSSARATASPPAQPSGSLARSRDARAAARPRAAGSGDSRAASSASHSARRSIARRKRTFDLTQPRARRLRRRQLPSFRRGLNAPENRGRHEMVRAAHA
jgi:hypothetical protein